MNIKELREQVDQLKGRRTQIKQDIRDTKALIRTKKQSLYNHEEAREILRKVGLETQQQLQYRISDITSLALEAIFPDPNELVAEFVERRNKTECDLYFMKNGNKADPLASTGGGVVDVASFALRVASWSMQSPRSRPVIFLDEPFKHLSTDLQPKASEMLKEISDRLGLQLIMVTHEEELMEEADKTFRVSIVNGVSHVEEE